jgi:quercetin 2,3-dioxygenase
MESTRLAAPEQYQGLVATENTGPATELPGEEAGFYLDQGHGKKRTVLGELITTLISGQETGGQFSVLLLEGPADEPIPAHVHQQEHEWAYILEGKVRWWCNSEHRLMYPGDSAYLPANAPHCFKFEGGYSKMLVFNVPAGFEGFFDVIGKPTDASVAPQEIHVPSEDTWREAAEKFGWIGLNDYDYGL